MAVLLLQVGCNKSDLEESRARLAEETNKREVLEAKLAAETSAVNGLQEKILSLDKEMADVLLANHAIEERIKALEVKLVTQNEQNKKVESTISGEAFIRNGRGEVIYLAGSKILLLDSAAISAIPSKQTVFDSTYNPFARISWKDDLTHALSYLNPKTVAASTANSRGSFEFHNIAAGNYVLYAEIESASINALWLIKIEINDKSVIAINLSNDNAVLLGN
jgi:hypothetical protein